MRPRRTSGTMPATLLVAAALSFLGVRLFLPGAASPCAPPGAGCCCVPDGDAGTEAPAGRGCGCTVSPAAPVPAATLAAAFGAPPPALSVLDTPALPVEACGLRATARPQPRARSAPTQELLETFRI